MRKAYRILVLTVLALTPCIDALGYYEKTHSYLVRLAAESIQRRDKEKLYEELYTKEFLDPLGRGGWREDFNPPVKGNERAMRHYYDPDSDKQLKGVPFQPFYPYWSTIEGVPVTKPKGGVYLGAMRWALDGDGNNFSWKKSIKSYGWGTVGSRREAYYQLGHVLHLLGDMAEPDHAANVPHPGSGLYIPDTLPTILAPKIAGMLKDHVYRVEKRPSLTERQKESLRNELDLIEKAIDKQITKLIMDEVERKYGSRRVRLTGFEGVIEDSVDASLVEQFFFSEERSKIPAKVASLMPPSVSSTKIVRHREFSQYFDELARKSKARQQVSGLPMALGCEDLRPYLRRFSDDAADRLAKDDKEIIAALVRNLPLAWDVMDKPIYALPIINEYDAQQVKPYRELGDLLLTDAVEHLAGMMMDYHDIVNEPPYVKSVRITQGSDNYYKGFWTEAQAVEVPTGRTIERYKNVQVSTDKVPRTVPGLGGRNFLVGMTGTFKTGQPTRVEITFGPEWEDEEPHVVEKIDPATVRVQIGSESVKGSMVDSNTWVGSFVPQLPEGDDEGELKITIEARDLHNHFPRDAKSKLPAKGFTSGDKGYQLDANPASRAEASGDLPDYAWSGYEPGVDVRHSISIGRGGPFREAVLKGSLKYGAGKNHDLEITVDSDGDFKGTLKSFADSEMYKHDVRGSFSGHCDKRYEKSALMKIDESDYAMEWTKLTSKGKLKDSGVENGTLRFKNAWLYLDIEGKYRARIEFEGLRGDGSLHWIGGVWQADEIVGKAVQ